MKYTDLSIEPSIAYVLARMIKSGHYKDILIYEFHEEIDSSTVFNCFDGMTEFRALASEFYGAFFQPSIVDNYPANIHLLFKLSGEWFVVNDCGANYYLGFGPQGILELRRNCKFHGVKIIYQEESLKEYLKKQNLEKISLITDEYEMIIKSMVLYGVGLQRMKSSFPKLSEDNIRDIMLPALNTIFDGRVNGETKNGKGKTDILLRENNGVNQYIFELKVWNSTKKFESGLNQLLGYLSWDDRKSGMLIFCYRKSLTGVVNKVKNYFKEEQIAFIELDETRENEFRVELKHPCDPKVKMILHLFFIDFN